MKKTFAAIVLGLILLMEGSFVLAQATDPCVEYCKDPIKNQEPAGYTCICSPIGYTKPEQLVKAITNWIFWIALIVAPIMIIASAFIFLTSAGDPGKTKLGRDMIMWTVIGLAVIMGSKLIVALVKRLIGA